MAYTISVLSQKGGTGKTTAVRTLADAFRRRGVRTLAIDLDPQGNLSDYFDLPPDVQPTIAEVLLDKASVAEATHFDMVPANLSLAEAELLLGGKMGRELTLRRALAKEPPPYELILIDCPPSLGLLTVNALVAADRALITAEAQYFALQGVEQAIEVVELARDSLNPGLTLLGVLLNVADMRTVHSREAQTSLRERFGEQVFDTVVRASIAYAESAERAISILDHRPDLGADYHALADEVLTRLPSLERETPEPPRTSADSPPVPETVTEVSAAAVSEAAAASQPAPHTPPSPAPDRPPPAYAPPAAPSPAPVASSGPAPVAPSDAAPAPAPDVPAPAPGGAPPALDAPAHSGAAPAPAPDVPAPAPDVPAPAYTPPGAPPRAPAAAGPPAPYAPSAPSASEREEDEAQQHPEPPRERIVDGAQARTQPEEESRGENVDQTVERAEELDAATPRAQ